MKVNIEYGHLYLDEFLDESKKEEIKRIKKILLSIEENNSQVVLIDDYNPSVVNTTTEEYIEFLSENCLSPDFVLLESELVKLKDLVMSMINNERLKKSYSRYINNGNKVPCPFLIATFYLLRLGYLEVDSISFFIKSKKEFAAERIVNILPNKYREVEVRALEILKCTEFGERIVNSINYYFI